MKQRLLVIKLGALGDFITALGAMKAIRAFHRNDHLTLLTTSPYVDLAQASGYFDAVLIDTKPGWLDFPGWFELRRRFNAERFDRVYDLQNNDRTAFYLRLFSPRPEWVGAAPGASHRNASPLRVAGHAFSGHQQTLAVAGITNVTPDTLEWLRSDLSRFSLGDKFALLIPGCAPDRPEKRWPEASFRAVAEQLVTKGIQPILLGSSSETPINQRISDGLACLDLSGKTSLQDLASLGRTAVCAIGNDTGPAHLISLTGCPTIMLYCRRASSIRKHGPLGSHTYTLEAEDLADLPAKLVLDELDRVFRNRTHAELELPRQISREDM